MKRGFSFWETSAMHGEEGESSDGAGSDGDSSEQENDGGHVGGGRARAARSTLLMQGSVAFCSVIRMTFAKSFSVPCST